MIDQSVDFERLVDLMHGKKFKYVKPGNALEQATTSVVTPEVFILQIDLLTSCTTGDLKNDSSKYPVRAESPTGVTEETKKDE